MKQVTDIQKTILSISVSNHLLLESLFPIPLYDKNRKFKKININKFNIHLVNIYTLLRNMLNSILSKTNIEYVFSDKRLVNLFNKEIETIGNLYENNNFKIGYYLLNYTKPLTLMNKNKDILNNNNYLIFKHSKKFFDTYFPNKYIEYDSFINNKIDNKKIITTTHISYDLLNKNIIYLLESHTGNILTRSMFNKKYKKFGSHDLSHLPFNKYLLNIFGDNTFIMSMDNNIKKNILDLAREKKWTAITVDSLVKHQIPKQLII